MLHGIQVYVFLDDFCVFVSSLLGPSFKPSGADLNWSMGGLGILTPGHECEAERLLQFGQSSHFREGIIDLFFAHYPNIGGALPRRKDSIWRQKKVNLQVDKKSPGCISWA